MKRPAPTVLHAVLWASTILAACILAADQPPAATELPNRLPEPAPYVVA